MQTNHIKTKRAFSYSLLPFIPHSLSLALLGWLVVGWLSCLIHSTSNNNNSAHSPLSLFFITSIYLLFPPFFLIHPYPSGTTDRGRIMLTSLTVEEQHGSDRYRWTTAGNQAILFPFPFSSSCLNLMWTLAMDNQMGAVKRIKGKKKSSVDAKVYNNSNVSYTHHIYTHIHYPSKTSIHTTGTKTTNACKGWIVFVSPLPLFQN